MKQALIHPLLAFVAVVGLGDWTLQFDWIAAARPPRSYNEPFQSGAACVQRAAVVERMLLKTLPAGSTDYRYEWHCVPHGMVY